MNESLQRSRFEAVILAAGYSSRMDRWKPEVIVDALPLLVHALSPAIEFCDKVFVVGGYRYDDVEPLIRKSDRFSESQLHKVELVENKSFSSGMFSSVKAGISKVSLSADGVFVVPGDMPFVQVETYKELARRLYQRAERDVFIPAVKLPDSLTGTGRQQKKGHPILIRTFRVPDILSHNDDAILRTVLGEFPTEQCLVDDKGICIDLDDNSDLAKYISYQSKPALEEKGN